MIINKDSTYAYVKNEAGGKGFNLYLLSQMKFPVPEWAILPRRFFDQYLNETGLKKKIHELIEEFINNKKSALEVENEILNTFLTTSFPPSLKDKIKKCVDLFENQTISVRSSASDEDGVSHSFAGQLSSFLYQKGEASIFESIKKCWASGFTQRGLIYRKENNLNLYQIGVSVILQKMIDPDKSGVLFTCDPIEKKSDVYILSAVYGVGEGLVSGILNADTYWLNSQTGKCLKREIVKKEEKLSRGQDGHCARYPISLIDQEKSCLTDTEIIELFTVAKRIHEEYHRPQDIEWAIFEGKVYILQTRAITSLDSSIQGFLNLWDNSNIVESYGGKTLPLSFSFALRNYKNVYVQFCEVLGLNSEIIKDMDSYLPYMLGSINGRVFYNLLNWYKLVGVLPGFQQNKQFMETMMGVTEGLSEEIEERTKSHPSWGTFRGSLRKFVTGFNFLKYHFIIQSMVDDFLETFHRDYQKYKTLPLQRMRGDELVQVYAEIERNMLGRWKAPIINDFLCMVHFGLLRKLTLKWFNQSESTLQNDLLAAEGGLESAEPTKALLKLATQAQEEKELKDLILLTDPKDCLEALNQSPFKDFYHNVLSYIDLYGFRCMSEMKLEEVDLVSDPSYLFVCLKNYIRSNTVYKDDSTEKNLRMNAEKYVRNHLSGIKKLIYFWVLKHSRKAIRNRENTRFARTRIYGIGRIIFRTIGEDLQGLGAIEKSEDIFWLTIEEVFGIYNATLPCFNLKSMIALRQKEYCQFEEEPSSRIMTRGAVYWNNKFFVDTKMTIATVDADLTGLPCCPGIIEGIVKVVLDPKDNLTLNGEILVTLRTDPGWVPLYPSISGLLVERGSLLSHSAIVAREMGIPAVVSIPNLTKTLKNGMKVRIDGKLGTIKIIS